MTPTRPHRRVPTALDYADVPEGARRLWRELDDMAREHASVHATLSQLATNLSCSTSAVQKWRRALVAGGWLAYEAAEHRGQSSLWTPLRRARPVLRSGARAVDKDPGRVDGRVDSRTPSHHGKGGRGSTLDVGATRAHGEEEEAHGAGAPVQDLSSSSPWCGRCDEYDRTVEVPSAGSLKGYALVRCPACHPAAVPAF